MNPCTGAPADQYALQYVEGTLPEADAERFEEHYFDCPVCLAHLQMLQAVGAQLATMQAIRPEQPKRRLILGLPVMTWALGSAVAALLVIVIAWRVVGSRPSGPTVAQNPVTEAPVSPGAPPTQVPVPSVRPSQLADLALPAFIAPNLRGASEETHFETGMKSYSAGDCRAAIATLALVPSQAPESRAARFYSAACQMRLGDFATAAKGMSAVAAAGDSPQQESAVYYQAQLALEANNPAAAHRYLQRTIALQGDLENRARAQDKKVQALVNGNSAEANGKPSSSAQ